MDYEIQRCTRHCVVTGREFGPGEVFYSALVSDGADLRREDYSQEAWKGPPEKSLGWWKSQMPGPAARRMNWAPNDVMLHFFDQLETQTQQQEMRYVLALLLIRRRVFRLEESERDQKGREMLVVYCPRRDATYRVPVAVPEESRIDTIQAELARLLFANAA